MLNTLLDADDGHYWLSGACCRKLTIHM